MLARLVSLIQPPTYPPYARGDWEHFESALGFAFPNDYKEIIWTFGSGRFFDFFGFYNPFDPWKYVNFPSASKLVLQSLSYLKSKYPDEYPFELFPKPEGLLPIGQTDNGDYIHWRTRGRSDEWTVVVTAGSDNAIDAVDLGLADFVCALAANELELSAFPPMDDAPLEFTPSIPKPPRNLQ